VRTIREFAEAGGHEPPGLPDKLALESGEALVWRLDSPDPPRRVRQLKPKQRLRRHVRKYSEGELSPEASFYFRGPEGVLNLRAYNLTLFVQLADGVDDDTWTYHLEQGEYSAWLRRGIKDDGLADEVAAIEADRALDARASRKKIREAINARYIAPATAEAGAR
jgi:hypothetical protein